MFDRGKKGHGDILVDAGWDFAVYDLQVGTREGGSTRRRMGTDYGDDKKYRFLGRRGAAGDGMDGGNAEEVRMSL